MSLPFKSKQKRTFKIQSKTQQKKQIRKVFFFLARDFFVNSWLRELLKIATFSSSGARASLFLPPMSFWVWDLISLSLSLCTMMTGHLYVDQLIRPNSQQHKNYSYASSGSFACEQFTSKAVNLIDFLVYSNFSNFYFVLVTILLTVLLQTCYKKCLV